MMGASANLSANARSGLLRRSSLKSVLVLLLEGHSRVNPDNLEKAMGKIKEELKRFINEPVTQEELSDVKEQALGHVPLSLESNVGIVRFLLSLQRFELSLDYLRELPAILEAVSAEDILASAQKHWELDRLVITSAGRAL